MKTFTKILLATGAALAVATPVSASTQSTTFLVTANVNGTCSIVANPLAFGAYTNVDNNATSNLNINCTSGTGYTVTMSNGAYPSGVQRRMKETSSANYLPYQIYTDLAHSTIWNTSNVKTGTGTGASDTSIQIYGKIDASQNPVSGSFSDTVTAIITY